MQLYKAVIKPKTSFISELQSDTFFGAFCWSYVYIYGEEELRKLLNDCWDNKPPIIFSNGFPSGTLPLPLGIFDEDNDFDKIHDKNERQKAYQNNKKIKKARFVTLDKFNEIINGKINGFTKCLVNEEKIKITVPHNMVSRDSGIVENTDGAGNLFNTEESFIGNKTTYDIYILSSLDFEVLHKCIELMFDLGIGASKSTGKGSFELIELNYFNGFNIPDNPNSYIALSNFIPNEDDPIEGYYKTFVKFPMLDREFSNSESAFKKPLLFIQSGANFYTNDTRTYYGKCIKDVSIRSKDITINACTIAIPSKLK